MTTKLKPRIMVVEDENITALSIKDSLEEMGYAVTGISEAGEEAIKLIKDDRPDLVMMDITLRGRMNGIEAARRIRSCYKIPVVYLTAHSEDKTFQQAKNTDPFGYLIKPFNDHELRFAIEIALYKHKMESALRESRLKYRALFNNAADVIYLVDAENHKIVDCNMVAEKTTGYSSKELKSMKIEELYPAEEQEVVRSIFRKIDKLGTLTGITGINQVNRDGKQVPVEINASIIYLGKKKHVMGIFRDITLRKKIETAREKERNRLTSILDTMEDCVYIVDRQYGIEYINPAFRKEFNALKGHRCFEYFHGRKKACPMCRHKEVFNGQTVRWEWTSSKRDKCFDIIDTPLKNADGSLSKLAILRDITERKKAEAKIKEASVTDGLTGLLNRHGFFTIAEQHVKLARRSGKELALVYMDLDNLKDINDTLGHTSGDQALTETADIIRRTFREADIAARLGGDEFAVLLSIDVKPGIDETISRHLQANLDRYNESGVSPFRLSISAGTARCDPKSQCSLEDLLNHADLLMYNNKMRKKAGRSAERRAHQRVKTGREFSAELNGDFSCAIKDLSMGGIRIETAERTDAPGIRNIKILRDNREVTSCSGGAVWRAAGAEGNYLTGFRFMNLNNSSKQSLERLMSEFGVRDAKL